MGGMLDTLSKLGLQMPSGQPEATPPFMPEVDPRQEAVESLIPMIEQMRNAATRTPAVREEELYKKKIQDMFGVKLGEKNPKWKSILRHLGETALDVGSTRYGGSTLKGQARQQAERDYKMENDVFKTEGMGALGGIVRSIGQDKMAAAKKSQQDLQRDIVAAKQATANSTTSPKAKMLLAQAEELLNRGDLNKAKVYLTQMQADLAEAKTGDVGKTSDIRNTEFFKKNPGLLSTLAETSMAKSAKLQPEGGAGNETLGSTHEVLAPDSNNNMVPRTLHSTREVKKKPGFPSIDAVRQLFDKAGSGALGKETNQPSVSSPGSPAPSSQSPANTPGTAEPIKPLKQLNLAKEEAVAAAGFNRRERERDKEPRFYSREKQKLVDNSNTLTRGSQAVVGGVYNLLFSHDDSGVSNIDKFVGGKGIYNSAKNAFTDKVPAEVSVANTTLKRIEDAWRLMTTGQGASVKELERLAKRLPRIGESSSIMEGPNQALQKALAIHFTASLDKWRLQEHESVPGQLESFFPEKEIAERITQISDLSKKMKDDLQNATSKERKAISDKYRKLIEPLSDPMALFEELHARQNPDKKKVRRF